MRNHRLKRKEQGLCDMCELSVVPGRTRCDKHLAYFRDRRKVHPRPDKEKIATQKKRDELTAKSLCIWCRQSFSDAKGKVCKSCREKEQLATKGKWRIRLEQGLCKWCGRNFVSDIESTTCGDCHCKIVARSNLKDVERWRDLKCLFDGQNICPYTGRVLVLGVNATLDHVVPRSAGGSNDVNNLQWVYGGRDFDVNMMKSSASKDHFLEAIKEIYRYVSNQ